MSEQKNNGQGDEVKGDKVEGDKVQGDKITHITYDSGRKIPRILSPKSATVTTNFMGREDDLALIRQKITTGNPLVLVNGEGGIGKTTLAAAYWDEYEDKYQHRAWLYCDNGIINTLRDALAFPLGIQEELNSYSELKQQYHLVKTAMANLEKDCLLVLDNANDKDDIAEFEQYFTGLGWHVLLTSRCHKVLENELYIDHLPEPLAKELFKKYYTEESPAFDTMLDRFLKAVGYNTLCIEIFSKNLKEAAAIGQNAESFLHHLEQKGLFLGDNSFEVHTNYTQRQRATTDNFLEKLYDLSRLTEAENRLLVQLALLPAENHGMLLLLEVFNPETPATFKSELDGLARKGWLFTDTASYRLSPVVQELVLTKNREEIWNSGEILVNRLNALFEHDGGGYILRLPSNPADRLAALSLAVLKNIPAANPDTILLYNRIFNYYGSAGNLLLCLSCAEKMAEQSKAIDHREGIAISYEKLGQTYTALGNTQKALDYYDKDLALTKELYNQFPDNVNFKNGLAISYWKLGDFFANHQQDRPKAKEYFTQAEKLWAELVVTAPDVVQFQQYLALVRRNLEEIGE